MILNEIERKEFERRARFMMEFLNERGHPHVTAIITPTSAELVEGVCSTGEIMDYVKP